MTVNFTTDFKFIEQLDDNLQLSFVYNEHNPEKNKTGALMQRDSKDDRVHMELKSVHPDSDKICINGMTYVLIKGKIKATWKWNDEDGVTEDDINVFKAYHENLPCAAMFEINYDMETKQFTIDIEYSPHYTEWDAQPCIYDIDSHFASIEFLSDDVELICIMRRNNITDWQVEQIDLLPDQEITVNKSGTDCYIVNTNDVLINDTTEFERIKGVMLTSNTAKYKNTSTSPQKLIKCYK